MADRFHFNPDSGRTGKCSAQVQCRFGQSDDQHGATREEARANYEKTMETELFANTVSKPDARTDDEVRESLVTRQYYPNGNYANYWKSDKASAAALRVVLEDQGIDSSRYPASALLRSTWMTLNEDGNRLSKSFTSRDEAELESYGRIVHIPELMKKAQKLADTGDRRTLDRMAAVLKREEEWGYPVLHKPLARYTDAQLDAEASDFEQEHRYSVREMMEMRNITEEDIEEAELDYGGFLTVKIPSHSEADFSTEIARRELKKIKEEDRAAAWSYSGSRYGYGSMPSW